MTPETASQLQIWRDKALRGELSTDELRQAIMVLREDRERAAAVSAKSKSTKAKKAPVDAEALLGELEGL